MSVSGLRSGNFDQAGITYDLSVGLDQDSGIDGQVLISGGSERPMRWGSNSANLPNALVKGTNITMTTAGGDTTEFDGLVRTTISSRDTTYQGDLGIEIDTGTTPETIKAKVDSSAQPTLRNDLNSDELAVLRVPNNLTCVLGLVYSSGTSYDGSEQRILNTKVDGTTIDNQGGAGFDELNVKKVPNTLTITKTDGTDVVYDGSTPKSIVLTTDTGITTLNAGDGISVTDVSDTEKTILVNKVDGSGLVFTEGELDLDAIPNTNLANSTISGISLGNDLANLTAGTNISFDVGTTYNGSSAITISSANTEYTEGNGIQISGGSNQIQTRTDNDTIIDTFGTGGGANNKLHVVKVPNTLTITDSAGTSVTFDGSAPKSITINDNNTEYTGTAPIDVDNTTDIISLNKDATLTTITNNLAVVKVPNSLTITDSAGTSVTFDGSAPKSITINDNNTEYTGTAPIDVDNTTDIISLNKDATLTTISDNLSVVKVPNTLTITDSAGTFVVYDGSAPKSITINDNNTEYTATQPIRISGSNVISIGLDDYPDGTETLKINASNEVEVVRVPNDLTFTGFRTGSYDGSAPLTIDLDDIPNTALANSTISGKELGTNLSNLVAGDNITFSVGTTYNGSQEITISAADDTTLNLIEGDGISIASSGADRTISVNADGTTLSNNVGSGKAGVLKVPNDLQTDCRMLNFRSGSTYNGIALRQLYINTQVRRREVFPTSNTTYDIYRRIKAGGVPNVADKMYPIDTNFNLTNIPNIRPSGRTAPYGYKVTISFTMLVDVATNSGDAVYLRIDKTNTYDDGWGSPVFISGGQDASGTNQGHHRHHATFVISATSTTTTYSIYPVIAVYNTSGTNDSRNNTPRITYGPQFGNLVMDVTPLEVFSYTTSSNPFSLPADDY